MTKYKGHHKMEKAEETGTHWGGLKSERELSHVVVCGFPEP